MNRPIAAVALATAIGASAPCARELPLWELGVGGTGLVLPDYRGSDEYRGYVLPFPYFVYRGDKLKVDGQRLRGFFFGTDRVEFDFSFNAAPPVESDRNEARRGMPDLRAVAEVGPSLVVRLYQSPGRREELVLRLPVRAAFAMNFEGAGFTFSPGIGIDVRDRTLFGLRGWNASLLGTVVTSTRAHHDYYYTVAPDFATASRPAYEAPGGFGGWHITASLSRRFDRFWIGGFVRYDDVHAARFESSPLVRQRSNVLAGIALVWIFKTSDRRVETIE